MGQHDWLMCHRQNHHFDIFPFLFNLDYTNFSWNRFFLRFWIGFFYCFSFIRNMFGYSFSVHYTRKTHNQRLWQQTTSIWMSTYDYYKSCDWQSFQNTFDRWRWRREMHAEPFKCFVAQNQYNSVNRWIVAFMTWVLFGRGFGTLRTEFKWYSLYTTKQSIRWTLAWNCFLLNEFMS